MRNRYLRNETVLNVFLLASFTISLMVSAKLGDYTTVSLVGLVMYAYLVMSGHFVSASLVMLTSIPFQILMVGRYSLYIFIYYLLLPTSIAVLRMGRSALLLLPVLMSSSVCALTSYPTVETPFPHYVFLSTTALLVGYSLRVFEELIAYGRTTLELMSVDVLSFFRINKLLKLIVGLYLFIVTFTLTFVTLLAYGPSVVQSAFISFIAGSAVFLVWTMLRDSRIRLALLLIATSVFLILGGSRLVGLLEGVIKLVEEVMGVLG
ncbi:MAG: hypothetical protein QW116_07100 [Zestosphaera sp.]